MTFIFMIIKMHITFLSHTFSLVLSFLPIIIFFYNRTVDYMVSIVIMVILTSAVNGPLSGVQGKHGNAAMALEVVSPARNTSR